MDGVEGHGEAGAAGGGVEEAADLDIDVVIDVGGVGGGGLEFPDGAAVIPEDGGHGGLVDALAALGGEVELGGAGAAARGRERECGGIDLVDLEGEDFVVVADGGAGGVEAEGEAVVFGEAEVEGDAEGEARGEFAAVLVGVAGEVGQVGRGVGKRDAVGDCAGAAPEGDGRILRGELGRGAGGHGVAEGFADGRGVAEIGARADLVSRMTARSGGGVEAPVVVPHERGDGVVEQWFGALEGAARDEIHGAGERGAGRLGGG